MDKSKILEEAYADKRREILKLIKNLDSPQDIIIYSETLRIIKNIYGYEVSENDLKLIEQISYLISGRNINIISIRKCLTAILLINIDIAVQISKRNQNRYDEYEVKDLVLAVLRHNLEYRLTSKPDPSAEDVYDEIILWVKKSFANWEERLMRLFSQQNSYELFDEINLVHENFEPSLPLPKITDEILQDFLRNISFSEILSALTTLDPLYQDALLIRFGLVGKSIWLDTSYKKYGLINKRKGAYPNAALKLIEAIKANNYKILSPDEIIKYIQESNDSLPGDVEKSSYNTLRFRLWRIFNENPELYKLQIYNPKQKYIIEEFILKDPKSFCIEDIKNVANDLEVKTPRIYTILGEIYALIIPKLPNFRIEDIPETNNRIVTDLYKQITENPTILRFIQESFDGTVHKEFITQLSEIKAKDIAKALFILSAKMKIYPREIIRICNSIMNKLREKNFLIES